MGGLVAMTGGLVAVGLARGFGGGGLARGLCSLWE